MSTYNPFSKFASNDQEETEVASTSLAVVKPTTLEKIILSVNPIKKRKIRPEEKKRLEEEQKQKEEQKRIENESNKEAEVIRIDSQKDKTTKYERHNGTTQGKVTSKEDRESKKAWENDQQTYKENNKNNYTGKQDYSKGDQYNDYYNNGNYYKPSYKYGYKSSYYSNYNQPYSKKNIYNNDYKNQYDNDQYYEKEYYNDNGKKNVVEVEITSNKDNRKESQYNKKDKENEYYNKGYKSYNNDYYNKEEYYDYDSNQNYYKKKSQYNEVKELDDPNGDQREYETSPKEEGDNAKKFKKKDKKTKQQTEEINKNDLLEIPENSLTASEYFEKQKPKMTFQHQYIPVPNQQYVVKEEVYIKKDDEQDIFFKDKPIKKIKQKERKPKAQKEIDLNQLHVKIEYEDQNKRNSYHRFEQNTNKH